MRALAALVWLLAAAPGAAGGAAGGGGVVRAVLFVSPTCPHCRTVKEEALPAFAERFGPQVEIAIVSTGTPAGLTAFWAACQRHRVQRPGVPMLLAGDTVLLGAGEIPALFPVLAETLLASGGSPWPDISGLAELLPDAEPVTVTSGVSPSPSPEASLGPSPEGPQVPARAPVAQAEPVVPRARSRVSSPPREREAGAARMPASAPPSAAGSWPHPPTLPPTAPPRVLPAVPDAGPAALWAR